MTKIGLILSGGGVRGFAHLGLLQALDESGIRPGAISGVSSGAIVGALYAAGHRPADILAFMKGHSYFGWSHFSLKGDGFFSMRPLLDTLEKYIPGDSFERLQTRLYVTATNFSRNEAVVFSSGPLYQAVIASASVPVIFEPVMWEGSLLMDGGLLNNFPLEPLEKECDLLIGSHVNLLPTDSRGAGHIGKANILERCFHLAIAGSVYRKATRCHLFIEPLLQGYNMFDINQAEEIYAIGYETARRRIDDNHLFA